jgi:hypothetical protein
MAGPLGSVPVVNTPIQRLVSREGVYIETIIGPERHPGGPLRLGPGGEHADQRVCRAIVADDLVDRLAADEQPVTCCGTAATRHTDEERGQRNQEPVVHGMLPFRSVRSAGVSERLSRPFWRAASDLLTCYAALSDLSRPFWRAASGVRMSMDPTIFPEPFSASRSDAGAHRSIVSVVRDVAL